MAFLTAATLAFATGSVRAEDPPKQAVALLPLDADAKLEIYGQPVASEIARALVAGGVDVVVVGPKMAVPERALLIVDGKIAGPPKGSDTVKLSVRIRSAREGLVLETIEANAPGLASIDRAAAELSARVLPVVRAQLEAQKPKIEPPLQKGGPMPVPPRVVAKPPPPPPWTIAVRGDARLTSAFKPAVAAWSPGLPGNKIEVDAKSFRITHGKGKLPLARARVHVRTYAGDKKTFDRVVVTDTVVGDRGMTDAALAERVAREVLVIARPHVLRGGR